MEHNARDGIAKMQHFRHSAFAQFTGFYRIPAVKFVMRATVQMVSVCLYVVLSFFRFKNDQSESGTPPANIELPELLWVSPTLGCAPRANE